MMNDKNKEKRDAIINHAMPLLAATANCLTVSEEEAALLRQNKLAFVMSGRHVYWVAHFDTPQDQTTRLLGSGLQVVGWAHEDGPNQGRIIYLLAADRQREHLQP